MESTAMARRAARVVFLAFVLMAGACLLMACEDNPPPAPTAIGGVTSVASPAAPPTTTGPAAPPDASAAAAPSAGSTFTGDTIKIGVDLSLSYQGTPQADMVTVSEGVQLAIEQANAAGGVAIGGKTYKLATTLLDDQIDPQISARNAQQLVADLAVLAVVGPIRSVEAPGNMPIFNRAGLAQISPANTHPALTRPAYGQIANLRPTGKLTYFRTLTTDDTQGPAAADFMYNTLRARKIYILDDRSDYGRPLADSVARRFREDGGAVLGRESLAPDTQDFQPTLKKAATAKPDALYFGGLFDSGGVLARKQMVAMGFNVPLVGADGIVDARFVASAGAAAEGSYGTLAAVNAPALPTARQFLADLKARFGIEPTSTSWSAYAAPAYDATNIIIAALKRASGPDRESVRQQIAATKDYPGALGPTSFDENGDTTNRLVSVFEVKDGAWTFLDHVNYKGALP
jgi:branched-chain amino acid transport system substrate-binding protein